MWKLIKKVYCHLSGGHDYPAETFDGDHLCFCTKCDKEVMNRTFDDLDPLPEDYEYNYCDDDYFSDYEDYQK